MNFYTLEFDDQSQEDIKEQEQFQANEEHHDEYEQSSNLDFNKDYTFDGYIQEEPVLIFNYIEEVPKKKFKSIQKKSKKIAKSDSETDAKSLKKSHTLKLSNDVVKLRQCQMLKSIISQMEDILRQTKKHIVCQYQKKQERE